MGAVEAGGADVEKVFGLGQVLQAVPSEVAQLDPVCTHRCGDQCPGGCRDDDLSPVGRSRDPCGSMDVDADVAVLVALRFSGVQAHPHAQVHPTGPGVLL